MTELLDPKFVNLPIPKPKRSSNLSLRKQVRMPMLHMAGLLYSRKASATQQARILIIRPDHLGDLLFLTPSLRYLRSLLPSAHISVMVGSWGEQVLACDPHIDELLVCEFPGFTRQPRPSLWQPYQYLITQARELKQQQFDLAIIARFDHWWGAWLAAAAGIPRRFGYTTPEVAPFLTDPLPYNPARHEVEQNWRLVHHAWSMGALEIIDGWSNAELMGSLSFKVSPSDRDWAEGWLRAQGVSEEQPLVVLHPGAGAPVKLWRADAWAELAQTLIDSHQCQIVLSGGPDEADLCAQIADQIKPKPPVAAGQTSLPQLAALMAEATIAIGPDTGPLKLAAAVGTPTVELYGPVDVGKFGPWEDRTRQRYVTSGMSCIACNRLDYTTKELATHFCVRGLSVDWVLQEVVDLLADVL